MAPEKVRHWSAEAWALTKKQHGVVARSQLAALGLGPEAIRHRLRNGRLHRLMPGVYAVGRPEVGDLGRWMAAVLACAPDALLSHRSAAALLGIRKPWRGPIEVVIPAHLRKRQSDIRAYRRSGVEAEREIRANIPVTSPAATLVDLTSCLPIGQTEAAINEADHHDLIDPETLREEIDELSPRPGLRLLRDLLDASTHVLTTTELERRFLPLALEAGLPLPEGQSQLGPHRVDFHWPALDLIVETDSLRYHRTPFKQAADKRRDNANARSGLITLHFTHGQVDHDPHYVRGELRDTVQSLASRRGLLLGSEPQQ
jgi:hypothetical protein